jgi:hypothetical protein
MNVPTQLVSLTKTAGFDRFWSSNHFHFFLLNMTYHDLPENQWHLSDSKQVVDNHANFPGSQYGLRGAQKGARGRSKEKKSWEKTDTYLLNLLFIVR